MPDAKFQVPGSRFQIPGSVLAVIAVHAVIAVDGASSARLLMPNKTLIILPILIILNVL